MSLDKPLYNNSRRWRRMKKLRGWWDEGLSNAPSRTEAVGGSTTAWSMIKKQSNCISADGHAANTLVMVQRGSACEGRGSSRRKQMKRKELRDRNRKWWKMILVKLERQISIALFTT
jgi:hypothetical protein